jgi:hypothetical protein
MIGVGKGNANSLDIIIKKKQLENYNTKSKFVICYLTIINYFFTMVSQITRGIKYQY